ncbi:conserved hypothetical protein [Culex quinquefasciatus]|uniref:Uncharacterized protein n=1 Tax=Culex quinquefasciatus TaxID=7176 RepID=B0XL92_CULQU|nr:conserved hypothetical protein [Culex quinquefasciatus]|eukprot:XP_001870414.1 conserved hypothetical protein [Culex quinquefasciatus]
MIRVTQAPWSKGLSTAVTSKMPSIFSPENTFIASVATTMSRATVAVLLLILSISRGASKRPSAQSISNIVLQQVQLLRPNCPTLEVFVNIIDDGFLEQTLKFVEQKQALPVKITSTPRDFYYLSKVPTACGLLLLDGLPRTKRIVDSESLMQTVAVVSIETFASLNGFLEHPYLLYLLYDVEDQLFRYYDRFRGRLIESMALSGNPFLQIEKDVMGMSIGLSIYNKKDIFLIEHIASEINATLSYGTNNLINIQVIIYEDVNALFALEIDSKYLIYIYRFHHYSLFVPQSLQKPMLLVLSDPFDVYIWVCSLAVVAILAIYIEFGRGSLIPRSFFYTLMDLVGVGLLGSSMSLRTKLEHSIVGLFMLISIVLVNESCNWYDDSDYTNLDEANFQNYGECDEEEFADMEYDDAIRAKYERRCCQEITQELSEKLFNESAVVNECYRISKLVTRHHPVFAVVLSRSPLFHTLGWFAQVFSEGHLYNGVNDFVYKDPTVEKHRRIEAVALGLTDLSLPEHLRPATARQIFFSDVAAGQSDEDRRQTGPI